MQPNTSGPCVVLIALLGCGAPSPTSLDDSSDSSSDSSTPTDTGTESDTSGDTGAPICDPAQCSEDCADESSSCGVPLLGSCTDAGLCECVESSPCPPCIEEQDCPYGTCTGPFGYCSYCFEKQLPLVLDPPESCTMPLPGFPSSDVLPYMHVEYDGEPLDYADDCADEVTPAYHWEWPFDDQLWLCPQACAELPNVTEAMLLWSLPCD